MSMIGELKFFLGLQIKQTRNEIYIHQTKYVKELLKRFNMDNAKEMKTPMHPTIYHGLDKKVDGTQYIAMIGSLIYLTMFRLDIMFSFCLCARLKKGKSIYLLLKTFSDILLELLTLAYALRDGKISNSQVIVMLTTLEISLKGRAQEEIVTSLVETW